MSNNYWLAQGSHQRREDGLCALEWVSFLAGEDHSDKPVCVSEMLTGFCISLNDALPDDQRQRMRPYLARTIGTRGDGLDEKRRWLCADWLVREYTPTFLELVPSLRADAEALRALPPVLAVENVERAMVDLGRARKNTVAAWDAARAVAGDAAWDAVRAAARAAVGDAAGGAATRAAVGDAVRDAVRSAARDVAWDAAGAAAWDAAGIALAPSVLSLQDSILSPGGLLDRMLPTVPLVLPVVEEWREVCASR